MRLGGPWEHGTPGTAQGNPVRHDLVRLRDAIRSGKRKRELLEDEGVVEVIAKYPRFAEMCYEAYAPKDRDKPEVVLIYGPPDVGKTRFAYAEDADLWKAPIGKGGWFNRYDGHDTVLMDDFAGKASHTALTDLLRLLDRYPESVPTKGGFVAWRPRRIFITTNIHPWEWYNWAGREVHYPSLKRRFTSVVTWRSNGTDRLELTPVHPLWERYWESYSISALSATSGTSTHWDTASRTWVATIQSLPGDWKRKFDYLYE